MSFSHSPIISRDRYSNKPLRAENTPTRSRRDSWGPKLQSQDRPNTVSGSKGSEYRSHRSKYQSKSNESFEKELLEFKMASPSPNEIYRAEAGPVSKFLNFEKDELEDRERRIFEKITLDNKMNKFMKCKIHQENFTFISPDERALYCTKCFYSKFEKLGYAAKKQLSNVYPLENAIEWISKENKTFIKVEGRQTACQIDHAISVSTFNNNFLLKKMDVYQRLITKEFQEIQHWLTEKERELKELTHNYFSQKMRENIDRLQELKFYQESFKKLFDLNQASTPEFSIFQFSFTNVLKKALNSADLQIAQLKDKDVEIIDFHSKKKLFSEIQNIGKPLNKPETSPNTPRASYKKEKSPVTSPSKPLTSHSISPAKQQYSHSVSPSKPQQTASSISPNKTHQQNISPSKRHSPVKVLPIVNVKALENISRERLPKELRILKTPEPPKIESLYPFMNEKHFFAGSTIFLDPQLKHAAIELFPLSIKNTTRLYSLRDHGASSQAFHELSDGKSSCLVLVKTFGKYVFGFYTPLPFNDEEKYCGSENFWIFSLVNDYERSFMFKIKPEKSFIAMYNSSRSPCLGSTLKHKEDLYIDFDEPTNSCSTIGYAYKLWDSKVDGSRVLSGQNTAWEVDEIEVYHIE